MAIWALAGNTSTLLLLTGLAGTAGAGAGGATDAETAGESRAKLPSACAVSVAGVMGTWLMVGPCTNQARVLWQDPPIQFRIAHIETCNFCD